MVQVCMVCAGRLLVKLGVWCWNSSVEVYFRFPEGRLHLYRARPRSGIELVLGVRVLSLLSGLQSHSVSICGILYIFGRVRNLGYD